MQTSIIQNITIQSTVNLSTSTIILCIALCFGLIHCVSVLSATATPQPGRTYLGIFLPSVKDKKRGIFIQMSLIGFKSYIGHFRKHLLQDNRKEVNPNGNTYYFYFIDDFTEQKRH